MVEDGRQLKRLRTDRPVNEASEIPANAMMHAVDEHPLREEEEGLVETVDTMTTRDEDTKPERM